MKRKKDDTSIWDANRGRIKTQKGGWVIGGAVWNHGYSQMDDLVGKISFFQVLLLNITGKLPEKPLADWLEALFICLSWPDSRLWCNQIGCLAGTMQASPVAGVTAGVLSSDSRMYGPGTVVKGVDFIISAMGQVKKGHSIDSIIDTYVQKQKTSVPAIMGYVRPIAKGDERVKAMERVTEDLGFAKGEYLDLAYQIEETMLSRYDEGMNLLGYTVAFLSDQKISATDQYRIISNAVYSGVIACYSEAADRAPESFFPLQCRDVDYQGADPRKVPDRKNLKM